MLVDVLWRNAQKSSVDCHLSEAGVWPIWSPVDTGKSTHRFTNAIRHCQGNELCVSVIGVSDKGPGPGNWGKDRKVCVL